MSKNELLTKIELLNEWEKIIEEAKNEAELIKDEIKAEMDERELDEMVVGSYIVRYKTISNSRFDSTAFKKYNVEEKLRDIEDCDILITQVGSGNFNVFTHLIGELRFKYKLLEPGVQRCGNYLVEIRRIHRDQNRQDPRNYLFLQN